MILAVSEAQYVLFHGKLKTKQQQQKMYIAVHRKISNYEIPKRMPES